MYESTAINVVTQARFLESDHSELLKIQESGAGKLGTTLGP